jgi:hypothetical protein
MPEIGTSSSMSEVPSLLRLRRRSSDRRDPAVFRFRDTTHHPIGSDDIGDLLKKTKDLVNEFQIEPHKAADEFFKLALDCGVHLMWAQYIEEHIGKMKLRKHSRR